MPVKFAVNLLRGLGQVHQYVTLASICVDAQNLQEP